MATRTTPPAGGLELRADCARCAGLCCVAPAFAASADFALDKAAGDPCPNLDAGFRCGIHARLREEGFPGCVAYDCFGAGQQVTQVTFGGADWRGAPGVAAPMFEAFSTMRRLHELAWYATEALAMAPARPLHADLRHALDEIERLAGASPEALRAVDITGLQARIGGLLARASELVRAVAVARDEPDGRGAQVDRRGADLAGADLRSADLRGTVLRGATLIRADLRRADLREADLAGADLRGADLAGADLRGSLFVTQSQLEAADGDRDTRLPAGRGRPAHWVGRSSSFA